MKREDVHIGKLVSLNRRPEGAVYMVAEMDRLEAGLIYWSPGAPHRGPCRKQFMPYSTLKEPTRGQLIHYDNQVTVKEAAKYEHS